MNMIDRSVLDKMQTEDAELLSDLLELFCERLPELLARFDRAIESADAEEIYQSAHIMKSRLRYLHCKDLGDLAAEIEKLARLGTIKNVDVKYTALKSGIAEAADELRKYLEGVPQ